MDKNNTNYYIDKIPEVAKIKRCREMINCSGINDDEKRRILEQINKSMKKELLKNNCTLTGAVIFFNQINLRQ